MTSDKDQSIFKVLQAVSHDIREPLRTISWYSERLLTRTEVKKDVQRKESVEAFGRLVTATQNEFRQYYDSFRQNREIEYYRDYAREILGVGVDEIETTFFDLWPHIKRVKFDAPNISVKRMQSIVRRLENRYRELLSLLGLRASIASSTNIREELLRVMTDLTGQMQDLDIDPDSITILGNITDRYNRIQIGLILQNLLVNSMKFRRKNVEFEASLMMWTVPLGLLAQRISHSHIRQMLSLIDSRMVHVLLFTDNGVGIDEDEWESVFTEFVRGKRSDAVSGSGMGLSIVRELVEQQGGAVWLNSGVGIGTRVFVVLPQVSDARSRLSASRLRDLLGASHQ